MSTAGHSAMGDINNLGGEDFVRDKIAGRLGRSVKRRGRWLKRRRIGRRILVNFLKSIMSLRGSGSDEAIPYEDDVSNTTGIVSSLTGSLLAMTRLIEANRLSA